MGGGASGFFVEPTVAAQLRPCISLGDAAADDGEDRLLSTFHDHGGRSRIDPDATPRMAQTHDRKPERV